MYKKNYEGLTEQVEKTQQNMQKFQQTAIEKIQTSIQKSEITLSNFRDQLEKMATNVQ